MTDHQSVKTEILKLLKNTLIQTSSIYPNINIPDSVICDIFEDNIVKFLNNYTIQRKWPKGLPPPPSTPPPKPLNQKLPNINRTSNFPKPPPPPFKPIIDDFSKKLFPGNCFIVKAPPPSLALSYNNIIPEQLSDSYTDILSFPTSKPSNYMLWHNLNFTSSLFPVTPMPVAPPSPPKPILKSNIKDATKFSQEISSNPVPLKPYISPPPGLEHLAI